VAARVAIRILRVTALIVVTALGVSCSASKSGSETSAGSDSRVEGSSASDPTSPTAPTEATDTAAALALLNGDIEVLTDQLGDPAVASAARTVLESGDAEPPLRFAASYVWANVGDDPAVLVPLLTDPDPAIALTAAIGVVAQGGREGFAPLIAALTSTNALEYYDTGEPAWSAANVALVQFTGIASNGPPFDANASQLALAQQRWQAWLDVNAGSLSFDAATGVWTTS